MAGDHMRTTLLDVTYPHSPVPVGSVTPGGYAGVAFGAGGGATYGMVGTNHSVMVLDLAYAYAPRVTDAIPHGAGEHAGLAMAECFVERVCGIVAESDGGIAIYDMAGVAAGPLARGGPKGVPATALEAFRHDNGRTYVVAGIGDAIHV